MSRIKELIRDLMGEPEALKPWNAIDEILSGDIRVTSVSERIRDELYNEE